MRSGREPQPSQRRRASRSAKLGSPHRSRSSRTAGMALRPQRQRSSRMQSGQSERRWFGLKGGGGIAREGAIPPRTEQDREVQPAYDEATAEAIRRAYDEGGELSGIVEFRRHFPLITDNARAGECVRIIAGWRPVPDQP